jgi:hypothetical protein
MPLSGLLLCCNCVFECPYCFLSRLLLWSGLVCCTMAHCVALHYIHLYYSVLTMAVCIYMVMEG